ncbi:RHS repeat-associated core domain-containing protein, partial [Salmonella enterica]
GLPLALIDINGHIAWSAESDEWGNVLREDNQHNLQQLIRLPGQQWDKESGLYYNRHRYYDPAQGRYITQDPVGLKGGWSLYNYPLNPVEYIDPLGLSPFSGLGSGFNNYMQAAGSLGVSMTEQGSSPEDISAAFEHMAKGDLPKQARQFVEGWVYGSASSFASIVACPSASLAVSGALTGGANALNQIWNGGDFSFSDVYVATNVGILTEGRSLVATTGINVAGYSISNVIKGTTQTVEGVVSTVFGSIVGFGTGKGVGTAASGPVATGIGAVVTEVSTSKANETLNE